TRGAGNANATITALLEPDGDGTKVTVNTDLAVTGKVAQFGRGVMADVSSKLLGQFVQCLETNVLSGGSPSSAGSAAPTDADPSAGEASDPQPAAGDGAAPQSAEEPTSSNGKSPRDEPTVRRIQSAPAQPVDLF